MGRGPGARTVYNIFIRRANLAYIKANMLIKEDTPIVAMKETKVNPPAQHCEIFESRNSFHELDELLPVLIVGKDFATTDDFLL